MKNKLNKKLEHKTIHFDVTNVKEVKAEDGESVERTIEGYASTFDNIDSYGDVVRKGAFKKTLQDKNRGRNVKFLYQHDPRKPIGVPLEIREDNKGLYFKAVFADTEKADEAYKLAKIGALDGFSIGFRIIKYMDNSEEDIRELLEIDLAEVSLVTFEANTMAKVTLIKSEEAEDMVLQGLKAMGYTDEEAETFLRELSLAEEEPDIHSSKEADDSATEEEANLESRKAEEVLHSLKNLKQKLHNKE